MNGREVDRKKQKRSGGEWKKIENRALLKIGSGKRPEMKGTLW